MELPTSRRPVKECSGCRRASTIRSIGCSSAHCATLGKWPMLHSTNWLSDWAVRSPLSQRSRAANGASTLSSFFVYVELLALILRFSSRAYERRETLDAGAIQFLHAANCLAYHPTAHARGMPRDMGLYRGRPKPLCTGSAVKMSGDTAVVIIASRDRKRVNPLQRRRWRHRVGIAAPPHVPILVAKVKGGRDTCISFRRSVQNEGLLDGRPPATPFL